MSLPIPLFLRRRTVMKVVYHLLDDWRQGRRFARGELSTTSGTILQGKDVEASIRYIGEEFRDYLRYGQIPLGDIRGRRILVVGPGDNLGVGLLFLAHGASQVTCLDRYEPFRDPSHLDLVYSALRETLSADERKRFDLALRSLPGAGSGHHGEFLQYVTGVGVEDCSERFPPAFFDLIFSRAVLEHLYDPDRAFASMDRILAPGGRMAHKIDLRDHEMFSAGGNNPLTFLTFPRWLWDRMTLHSGKPNRRLFPYYDGKMRELGYETVLFITHVFGREGDLTPHPPALRRRTDYDDSEILAVRRIRTRLAREYRAYTDEELLISGIFLSARKPPGATPETTSSNRHS